MRFLCSVVMACLACGVGAAQQPPPPPSSTQAPSQSEEEVRKQEQSQRVLGIMPMFGVTSRQDAPPLTTKEKFVLAVKQQIDPFQWVAVGFQAGIAQASDEFPEYGQGAQGFGKRYGAGLADGASSALFSNFVFPVAFKQDPRYFRSGQGSTLGRVGYSLKQEFVCHTDRGGRAFNWSNVLGSLTSGGISNAYYPPSDRGFGLTMSRTGIALLYGAAGGLLNEFWPDIRRKVFHKTD